MLFKYFQYRVGTLRVTLPICRHAIYDVSVTTTL